jgi:hypothetical protein
MHVVRAEPRPEDFGITADDLARTPMACVARYRAGLLAGALGLTLAGAFATLAVFGSDPLAALFFAVIGTAAASIVAVPLMVCLLCAGERAEVAFRSRRNPAFSACTAFRDALAAYQSRPRRAVAARDRAWFARAGRDAVRLEIARRLTACGIAVDRADHPEADGFDLVATTDEAVLLIRCLDGDTPAGAGIAREMATCLHDRDADGAIVYSIRGATPDFDRARRGRPIRVEDPSGAASPSLPV